MTTPNSHRANWLDYWHVNPSSNREYDFIDGLRGIAILMVLSCHHFYINPKAGPTIHFLGALAGSGAGGVELFFALSGFLISWPFWKRKILLSGNIMPPRYALRRFWKIYPPMALSVVFFAIFYFSHIHDPSYFLIASQWLSGLAFLVPVSGKFNPVMWTLVIEVQFYILLPLIFISLKNVSIKTSFWIMTLIFLVTPTAFQSITGLSTTFYPEINSHFPSKLNSFYFGIMIAGLDSQGLLKKSWANLGTIGAILWAVTLLFLAYVSTNPGYSSPTIQSAAGWSEKIASGCLLFYVADPRHPIAQMLCASWLRWCGVISYEWYLFHQPIILWSRHAFGPAEGAVSKYVAIVGGSFLFSTILAALVYKYFSLPILKYGRERPTKTKITPKATLDLSVAARQKNR